MDTLALKEEELEGTELEVVDEVLSEVLPPYLSSVTAAVSLVIMLRTVTFSMTSAPTVGQVATSPKTVLSLSEKDSSAVTPVAHQGIWPVIVTIRRGRSATLVANMATFRNTVPESSATVVARPATWPSTVINCSKRSEVNCYRWANLDI